ncbi:LytR/AlgR family response regulator transcription factor [Draconibacterium sp. IB214405]|uniref:LytR/AlgR family response regulator transcription factor n=1 Tax=Draconibacterium sp. IB214405 TaxID=3097352 RepID=UPI003FA45393
MECLVINTSSGSEIIWLNTIIYCSAEGSYSRIHLDNKRKVYCSKNLTWLEQKISSPYFVRMHRSYIVNLRFIHKIVKNESRLFLANGEKLPVSKSRSNNLWESISLIS